LSRQIPDIDFHKNNYILILNYTVYSPQKPMTEELAEHVAQFLHTHLGEYGDPIADIRKAIDYSLGLPQSPGGFIWVVTDSQNTILGATVVNKTGMQGYIPPYILVYIAVHHSGRGQGIGSEMMKLSLDMAEGDVALHVEGGNPAKRLYEKLGFSNKYLEMRYKKI
jgi:GNAT superfamily N-acetyltransferase